ncbi:MAG TPA: SUMF1/EgtB/PvdO family nonheme iron enzyme, partial [Rhodocyclaceae bacterium]|nr:SUMF1/EgtB/PvdO family nonheme iron enzyme [Rhodocyclaceae bacterium]
MGLLHRAHAHLPPAVLHEERLTAAGLANPSALAAQGAQVDRSARFLLSAAASFHGETAQLADAKAAWARRLLDRGDAAQRSRHPAYSVLYAAAYRQALLDGAPAVPDDGLDRQEILRALADPTASPTRWDLVQDSHTLRLVPDWTPLDRAHLRVSLLARLRVTSPLVAVQTPGPHGGLTMQPLGMDPVHLTRLAPEGLPIKVSTGSVEIVVDAFPRPPWARAIGRDAEGLWCDAEWLGQRVRLRWGALEHAPHWGWQPKGGVGVDTFGLYADFTVAGVTQRCRWIAPGSFRMGSPPDEVDRSSNETQHDVTLTRGYWLADSACTQALWQAVMGDNPSRFKADPANPVEQVSWNDVHTFLDRLNAQVPGLDAGLPSEAQWEYACRAGTTTPFSFGENITPEQVNYDGNRPYADGKKGLDRGQTVPVKSLPPNPWGLYEMHGNVYEWCADWFGDYPQGPQIDPSGPPEGVFRVLRGGSWSDFGQGCRAATRFWDGPGFR